MKNWENASITKTKYPDTNSVPNMCKIDLEYIEIMRNSFLDPFDNIRKEDFTDIFKSPEDKKLIDLFLDECKDCGERLTDCDCSKNNPDLNWAKERFPQLFR